MKKSIIKAVTLVAILSAGSVVQAAGNSINLKTASYSMSNASQNIGSYAITFDDSSSSVFSIEYEKQFGKNLSWGVELVSFSNDITASSPSTSATDMDTTYIMGTIRKYFDVSKHVQPYIGGGAGISAVTIIGSAAGIAFQGMAGVKFPFDSVSAILEYKVVSSDAEDAAGASVDVSGSGIFAGIAINF